MPDTRPIESIAAVGGSVSSGKNPRMTRRTIVGGLLPALVLVGLRGAEGPWVGRFTASAAPSPKTIPSGAPDGGLEVVVLPWPEHAENTSNRIQKLPAGLLKENRVKLWVVIERTRTPRPQCGERRKCRSDRKL